MGCLERYQEVYDTGDYFQHLPQRIGSLFARRGDRLYDDVIQLLEDQGVEIPEKAYLYEKQFRLAMHHLESEKQRGMTGNEQ